MTDRTAIEADQYLPHPPARVWRALTDPDRLARWPMPNATLDTTVTWLLQAEGRGTRLFLHHDGFDPNDPLQQSALTIMGGGWRSHVMRKLEAELADHIDR
jgi:uncharacterized protein YndB with AHSA1/START domain